MKSVPESVLQKRKLNEKIAAQRVADRLVRKKVSLSSLNMMTLFSSLVTSIPSFGSDSLYKQYLTL
jgi:hypothetical protein